MFSFNQLKSGGVPDVGKSSADCHNDDTSAIWSQNQLFVPEACQKSGFLFDSLCDVSSGLGSHTGEVGEGSLLTDRQQQAPVASYCSSLHMPHYGEDMREPSGNNPNIVEKGDVNSFRFSSAENIPESSRPGAGSTCPKTDEKSLTTEEIFRVAGEKFIQSSSSGDGGDLSHFRHPTDIHYSNISKEQINDVELASSLFSAAESVALEQLARATRLLNNCELLSSCDGSAVQRVVHYFSEALRERIDRLSGNLSSKGLNKLQNIGFNFKEAIMSPHPAILTFHRKIPLTQPLHFAGMQAIMENVADAKKVHIIDFGMRYGVCWTILIQALASRGAPPLEILKLTAVGTLSRSNTEDAGNRLSAFAQSLNIPFTFNVVMVDDMINLNENLFELDNDEAVAVYAPYVFKTMLCVPDRLDHMMRVIRCINPSILVMIEIEANTNAPCFGNRFTEALFYYAAYFECLATCTESSDPSRIFTESLYGGEAIRNILTTEGAARTVRHVKLSVWRTFFARFGYTETKLSRSSLYQANLVLKEFASGRYCNLKMEGKSIVIGWKGTSMVSVSAWKFA
ncbi:unnamed protein product [Rhodiola kirilowii]